MAEEPGCTHAAASLFWIPLLDLLGRSRQDLCSLYHPHGPPNTPTEPPSAPHLCSGLPNFWPFSGNLCSLKAGQGPCLITRRPQAEHDAQHRAGT